MVGAAPLSGLCGPRRQRPSEVPRRLGPGAGVGPGAGQGRCRREPGFGACPPSGLGTSPAGSQQCPPPAGFPDGRSLNCATIGAFQRTGGTTCCELSGPPGAASGLGEPPRSRRPRQLQAADPADVPGAGGRGRLPRALLSERRDPRSGSGGVGRAGQHGRGRSGCWAPCRRRPYSGGCRQAGKARCRVFHVTFAPGSYCPSTSQ